MAALAERLGPFDIVIANAGAAESAPFLRTDPAHWQQMIGVNLTGTYTTFHATLAPMLEQGWGRLIAVASTAGIRGYAYATAYSAAKHGTVGLVRALAQETARKGVTVNALCPGFLDTEMTERSIARIRATTGMDAQEARRSLEAMSPQRRLIAPSEVVSAAMWLCGPGSEGVTGQTISISGGET
jgi:NAD(P)-dependent dehydrogenase (short-subunit alcohol dehydrogenase family)